MCEILTIYTSLINSREKNDKIRKKLKEDIMSNTLIHNADECKYEYHIDDHVAYITYEDQDGNMHLTETQVPEALAGQGLAKTLLEDVLEEIKKANKKAVAKCSYIVKYQEKNPEKSDLFA